ncbi:FadR family transcriptional regulator [Laceyella sacchari]|jgi:GntR family transcriptional repressor for pyruvate dehydrogenase complex|uniref:Transcriptional regulator, GntR family n=1 Tax=Laceyella tengchongensis TaxID=574699 RepID=A0AA46AH99_9BACL|nr:FadR/GntR family transcriptional regulator [Laceyella tengchongensis]AUS09160.1 FadR family transcriptional regulator [Laceyella sacchari]SMP36366.1 transcriptional regulator, GntR family [Laceyella tengchongensis]
MFKPIFEERSSMSERIISQIMDAIVKGEVKPGERLPTERDLATLFQVSRTVVRDAIKTLAGRNILHVKHGKGIFVANIQPTDIESFSQANWEDAAVHDLFEIRKVLETEAAAWAAERRQAHHLEKLEWIIQDAKAHSDEPEVLDERDAQFHMAIAEASCNLVLVKIMLSLLDLLAKSRQGSYSIPGRSLESLQDHELIIEAIREKDRELARQRMLQHLEGVEQTVSKHGNKG